MTILLTINLMLLVAAAAALLPIGGVVHRVFGGAVAGREEAAPEAENSKLGWQLYCHP